VTTIVRTALLPYSPEEMYALVNDVAAYPAFLPWCRASRVISETATDMVASIEIARGVLNRSFTTHNHLQAPQRIELALVDGPFRKLHGHWQFATLKTANACKVTLQLDFEFDNSMISLAARPVFTQIVNSLVDAFSKRASEVYGERS
jgi:ribosome-associated toxin RatA of RatAB toxin-antitoxin module